MKYDLIKDFHYESHQYYDFQWDLHKNYGDESKNKKKKILINLILVKKGNQNPKLVDNPIQNSVGLVLDLINACG